jgi:ankyrin repeat protein
MTTRKTLPPPPYSVQDEQLPVLPPRPSLPSSNSLQQNPQFSRALRPSLQTSFEDRPIPRTPETPRPGNQSTPSSLELEKGGFISARPYFQLHSYDYPRPRDTLYHVIVIGQETGVNDLPYPPPSNKWSERAANAHNWDAFLHHLFPKHSIESHSLATHKQLEVGSGLLLQRLQIGARRGEESSSSSGTYPVSKSRGLTDLYGDNWETERLRRLRLNATAAEWNEGFFEPRGLKVVINFDTPDSPRISTPPSLPSRPSISSTPSISNTPSMPTTPSTSSMPGPAPVTARSAPIKPQRSVNVLQKPAPPPKPEETRLHQAVAKGSKSKVKSILEKGGESLETPDFKGETALYRAVVRGDKSIVQLLLEKGANPAARPLGCNSPIHLAVDHDRKGILEMLLERTTKEDVDEITSAGETALYLAIQKKYTSCAKILLAYGANPQSRPAGHESMLNLTFTTSQASLVPVLLEYGADVEERNKDGDTPLCRSVIKGDTKAVEALLKYGATGAARTVKGEVPLSIAVSRGNSAIVALLLAQDDIDVEVKNAKGETPLYTAVMKGESSIAKLLLIKGASPTFKPPSGESVLNMAVSKGNSTLTHLLLEGGADLEVRNKSGETPLFKAVSKGDSAITSLLVGKGALVNTMNQEGETALYKAVYKGDTAIVSLLLCNGANTETPGPNGETPLSRAVRKANTSIVNLLLCNGANPETPSPQGETPLYRAVSKNDSALVSLLLGRGASPNIVNRNGDTPMLYATKKGNQSILHLLQNYSMRKVG